MGIDDDDIADGRFSCLCYSVVAVVLVVGIITACVVAASFGYLEYYELGLTKQKSTGKVFKSKVYSGGRYFIGPDFEFKVFPADVHDVELKGAKVFTSDKLEVTVNAHFQYVIRKNELVSLHDAYNLDYNDTIIASALDALKGAMTVYNTRSLIGNRSSVEENTWKAIRERLGGTCCNQLCGPTNKLCQNCLTSCTSANYGMNVEVKYFQLGSVVIPSEVETVLLRQLLEKEQAEEELLKQEAIVVRKSVEKEVQFIKNQAAEISQDATAQASLIAAISQANYTAALEQARTEGLKNVFNALGFTQQNQKNSFDYLRTVRGLEKMHITVDYQQKIAGNLA